MNKYVLTLAMALWAENAFAYDWRLQTIIQNQYMFFDAASVTLQNGILQVWTEAVSESAITAKTPR